MAEVQRERNEIERELNQFSSGEQQIRMQLIMPKRKCSC